MKDKPKPHRVIVFGSPGVGRHSILSRFVNGSSHKDEKSVKGTELHPDITNVSRSGRNPYFQKTIAKDHKFEIYCPDVEDDFKGFLNAYAFGYSGGRDAWWDMRQSYEFVLMYQPWLL